MHGVRRRLMAAGVVLAGGTVAALPFYHGPLPASPGIKPAASDGAPPTNGASSGTTALPLQIPGSDTSHHPTSSEHKRPFPGSESVLPTAAKFGAKSPISTGERRLPAPQLSEQHPAAAEVVPPASAIRRADGLPDAVEEEAAEDAKSRLHWIVDGDSLEELARRFLGNRSRWREIREANPDVLKSDDLLPIGKEIRIPPRRITAPPAVTSTVGTPVSTGTTAPTNASDGLVPIPYMDWTAPVRTPVGLSGR